MPTAATKLIPILVLGLLATTNEQSVWAKNSPKPLQATVLKAHLIYDEDGAVDSRDLTAGKLALWNTPLGEGDAGKPSSSVIVLVGVPPMVAGGRTPAKLSLHVRSKATKRSVFTETVPIRSAGISQFMIPFLVRGTGCEAIEIEAVVDSGPPLVRTVPFGCGE
jgi:hypothetical protein